MSNIIDPSTSELTVENFGPIHEATVELRPLTVFAGPSNTGKSYLAILIYALHRIFGGRIRYGGAGGVSIRYPDKQKKAPRNAAEVLNSWLKDMQGSSDVNITNPVYRLLHPILSGYDELFHGEVSRCFGTDIASLIRHPGRSPASITIGRCTSKNSGSLFKSEFVIDKGANVVTKFPESAAFEVGDGPHTRFNDIQYFRHNIDKIDSDKLDADYLLYELFPVIIPSIFGTFSHSGFYLPADRAGIIHAHRVVVSALVERAAYADTGQSLHVPALSGVLVDFLNSLLGLDEETRSRLFRKRSKELKSRMDNLAKLLENDILHGSVVQKTSEAGYPIFFYRPEGWKKLLGLMNTSSMVSELAPIALYLRYVIQEGDVLIIEEPESHLHPSMQAVFTRQLAAMVKSGIRVLITTHSEWILEALANLVHLSDLPGEKRKGITGADQALTPEQVGVWLFEPRNRPKGSIVKEVRLDHDSGLFDTKFDDVGITLQNDWAKINSRMEGA